MVIPLRTIATIGPSVSGRPEPEFNKDSGRSFACLDSASLDQYSSSTWHRSQDTQARNLTGLLPTLARSLGPPQRTWSTRQEDSSITRRRSTCTMYVASASPFVHALSMQPNGLYKDRGEAARSPTGLRCECCVSPHLFAQFFQRPPSWAASGRYSCEQWSAFCDSRARGCRSASSERTSTRSSPTNQSRRS